MEHRLIEWLAHYGTRVLFFAQMFGIFGVPIPDELLLTTSGALARQGTFTLTSVLPMAIAGCMTGITFSYVLGRTFGLLALRRVIHVSDAAFDRAQRWFHRFGGVLLLFGYFIPGIRHVTAIAAGSAPLEYRWFAAFAYPGALIWSVTFVMLGYYAGGNWRAFLAMAHAWLPVTAVVAGCSAAVAVVLLLARRRAKS